MTEIEANNSILQSIGGSESCTVQLLATTVISTIVVILS